jgi:ATP/maltotriose-dependent transcriptional regulator MalT
LKRALRVYRNEPVTKDGELRWMWLACYVARHVGDDAAWDELTARQVELARRAGAFSVLPVALDDRFSVELLSGRLAVATSLAGEADAVVEATGSQLARRTAIALASWRGREAEARALTEARREDVLRRGEGLWLVANDWGTAVLYNGLGRYDEALAILERAATGSDRSGLSMWLRSELVESAVRAGKPDHAAEPLARLATIAEANGTDWSLGLYAARAAMLAEGDAAEHLYREAIERLSHTRIRIATARAQLLYGEWLRRENRRVDAREQLKLAREAFADMGNEPFAERARRELLATGETVRKRTVETLDDLTPQETQIGRMAADGFTNPEIGAQLFLSPRTVEWHLRKVFGKLGISSRRELRTALPDVLAAAVPV